MIWFAFHHGFVRIQIGWDSVMRMSADVRDLFLYEAFLYYNPLLLVVSEFLLCKCLLNMFFTIIIITFVWLLIDFLVLVLQTMMVWLWGINLWFFSQSNVNYAKIFELDQNHLTHHEIWKVKNLSHARSSSFKIVLKAIIVYFSLLWPAIYTLCTVSTNSICNRD